MRRLDVSLTFIFLFSSLYISHIACFTFQWTFPTQCDQFNVTWKGGAPPYRLLVAPVSNQPFLGGRMYDLIW